MPGPSRNVTLSPGSADGSGDPSRVRPRPLPGAIAPRPAVVVVGASTGGPQALVDLFSGLSGVSSHVPICVTLHMPPELMPLVAGHVARQCRVATQVVGAPCRLLPGTVYFAPGDRQLRFERHAERVELSLAAAVPRSRCKPAVDTMFIEAVAVFRARTLGVVLSGMGEDGLAGARAIVGSGGTVLVQDKASSAVWGMPGAVAKAGLAAAVLPAGAIALEIARRVRPAGSQP